MYWVQLLFWEGAAAAGAEKQNRGTREASRKCKGSQQEQIPIPSSNFAISVVPLWAGPDKEEQQEKEKCGCRIPAQHHITECGRVGLELRGNSLLSGILSYHCTNPLICNGLLFKFCILKAISMPHIKNDHDQGIYHFQGMLVKCPTKAHLKKK